MGTLGRRFIPMAPPLVRDLGTGLVAGAIGGLLAAATLMTLATSTLVRGPGYPFQVLATFMVGDAAMRDGNLPAILLGFFFLMTVPVLVWSLVFGLCVTLFEVRRGWGLAVASLLVAVVAQVVNNELVAPAWLVGLYGHDLWAELVPPSWSWIAHLAWGLGLNTFTWAYQALWGARPRNWARRRRTDPFDPLGA